MEFIRLRFPKGYLEGASIHEPFRNRMAWAEFALRKRIINCLLVLLSISTIFALAMVARIATDGMSPTTFVIGALMTATVGCIGKLLNNSLKSIFRC